jgi:CTP:molybdopterin cytidylyltransferase MocA
VAIAGVVLAAGAGSRFGGRKLSATLDGRPILDHVVEVARAAGLEPLIVVVGPGSDLRPSGTQRIVNERPERGLSTSLQAGLAAVPEEAPAAVILLGDQPLVRADTIRALVAAADAKQGYAVLPRYADGGGPNPVLLPRSLFGLAQTATGDRGIGPVLAERPDIVIEVPAEGSNPDVDTPADLDEVREMAARRIVPGR